MEIDLKPNLIKVTGSILFAPISSFVFLIIYGSLRCFTAICAADFQIPRKICTSNKLFLCCSGCIRNSTQKLGMLLLFIVISFIFLILVYVIYSLISKEKVKSAIFNTLVIWILIFGLFLIIFGGEIQEIVLFFGGIILGAYILYRLWKKVPQRKGKA